MGGGLVVRSRLVLVMPNKAVVEAREGNAQ
eukprot:COSAG03_NODE_500_length_7408_cov_13.957587_3_plen_30_part_00